MSFKGAVERESEGEEEKERDDQRVNIHRHKNTCIRTYVRHDQASL